MKKKGGISGKLYSFVIVALLSMVTLLGFSQILPAQEAPVVFSGVTIPQSPDLTNEDALFARAAQFGSVRVIVGFDVGFQPEGALRSAAQVEDQRLAIDIAQDIVLNSLASYDVRNVTRFTYIPYIALEVDEAALDALWMDPNIISIHEDVPLPLALEDSVPLINAPDVWSLGFDSSGVAVAILDTGVRSSHEFLDDGKVVSEACYSSNNSTYGSKTVCPNGKQSQTGPGAGKNCALSIYGCDHGTHVAGIAAGFNAASKNPTFHGVARGADIIAIQVFSRFTNPYCTPLPSPCVLSFISDQIKGLERVYALRDKYNIAAVNMSLGGGRYTSPCDSEPQKAIIDNLRSAGIATVIASGNNGYTNALGSPACISTAVSVGATEKDDDVASFSNSASFLDLLAPGVSIRSSVPNSKTSYARFQGTSMAAPHVAGVFALLRQANPTASVSDILTSLKDSGVDIEDPRNGITKPRIDVAAALDDLGFVRPEITDPVPGNTISDATVEFSWIDNGLPVENWELWVGTAQGGNNVFDGPRLDAAATSQMVNCIPLTGDALYVRLRFKSNGFWTHADFQYLTQNTPPTMQSPSNAILTDNMVTFGWNQGDLCVDAWMLYVGTSQGADDLADSGKLPATDTTHTVKGLPFDGSPIYVRLRYRVAGSWKYVDFTYTAVTWNIEITAPDPVTESQLKDTTVTFTWSTGGAATAAPVTRWRLLVGSGKGKNNYFDSGALGSGILFKTVKKLPFDGRPVYVRLKFRIHGIWERTDYLYTAVDTLPKITSPAPGSTLAGYVVPFQWTPEGHNVKKWKLYIGSAKGKDDYHNSGVLGKGILNDTCETVPTDGRKVHVRLRYKKGNKWKKRDYQYTAANKIPTISSPSNGAPLQDISQEFAWDHNDAYVRKFRLWVGSSAGGNDIYDSGNLPGSAVSHTASGLPFDGSAVYVRHRYMSGVKWKSEDYQYTAVDTAPEIISPADNDTLDHSTVEFVWQSDVIIVQKYRLYVGNKLGENDLYDSGLLEGSVTSHSARKLPINGRPLYVRLRFKVGGVWYKKDYQYTAVTWNFEITDPPPTSTLSGSSETFSWMADTDQVTGWRLKLGTSSGANDIYDSGWLGAEITSQTVSGLPVNGKKIYAKLFADFSGDRYANNFWFKAKSPAYARLFNDLRCGDGTRFDAILTICGKKLTAESWRYSSCKKLPSGTCSYSFVANLGSCGPRVTGSGVISLQEKCIYDFIFTIQGSNFILGYVKRCPGNCNTSKPFAQSVDFATLLASGEAEIIAEFPIEPDFDLDKFLNP